MVSPSLYTPIYSPTYTLSHHPPIHLALHPCPRTPDTHAHIHPVSAIAQALRIQSGSDKQASHTAYILVAKTLNKTRTGGGGLRRPLWGGSIYRENQWEWEMDCSGAGASVERANKTGRRTAASTWGGKGCLRADKNVGRPEKASMARWNWGL